MAFAIAWYFDVAIIPSIGEFLNFPDPRLQE